MPALPRSREPTSSWLDRRDYGRVLSRLDHALSRSRAAGQPLIASLTAALPAPLDPSAIVLASRRPEEPWFCLEQPDRDGWALGALGSVRALESRGAGRFGQLAADWRALSAMAVADPVDGPAGTGLVAAGGFAFAPDGADAPRWQGFAPASLVVPELSLARRGEEGRITVNVAVAPDDTVAELQARVDRRLAELRLSPLPLLDPSPAARPRVLSAMPPSHYEHAVARAVSRIRAGELEKVVLAREVEVHAASEHDPGALVGLLREAFPSCYVFAAGRGPSTFLGASPELLVRREGQRASTVALAGSTRRSADPAVDDHLGEALLRSEKDRHENAIVARRIGRSLARDAVWVTAAPEPALVRVANIQHLATPIRAQLREPLDAIDLAGRLHPTPAVGGEPAERARALIPALEGFDRGWYTGPVGFVDAAGDGEFCVALRCALLRGEFACCYAGCGVVGDSDPAAELAESEVKLEALLPLLAS